MKGISEMFQSGSLFGKLVMLIGVLVGMPLMLLPFYPNERIYTLAFLVPMILSIGLGFGLCLFTKKESDGNDWRKQLQYSHVTVLMTWVYGFVAGAMPFVLSGQLTFVKALFESVSGWTTTGLSVVVVGDTPNLFLFHRSFMQFCGGLGFVMVMLMFFQGKQAMNLFRTEGHPDKLLPNLRRTARITVTMFVFFLILGTGGYWLLGMPILESVIHAMSALSTGGFSTEANSIGAYGSLGIEVVTIVLMIVGTTNFAVLWLLTKRRFRQVAQISEVRFMGVLIVGVSLIIGVGLFYTVYENLGESLRIALFNVVSALSTTGFSTVSYVAWPPYANGLMIVLMLIGGGLGSTAGGIKLSRVYIFLRMALENLKKRVAPSRRITAPYYYKAQGRTAIDTSLMEDTSGFIFYYLLVFILGTLLVSATTGTNLTEAMFEFSSALGTVGLSLGMTGPELGDGTLWVLIIGMVLGRLEMFMVFIGIQSGVTLMAQRIGMKKDTL